MYDRFARKLDARYGIPRPINYQSYSDTRALLELIITLSSMLFLVGVSILGAICLVYAGIVFYPIVPNSIQDLYPFAILAGAFFLILVGWGDASLMYYCKYSPIYQRETHGNAAWATRFQIDDAGYLVDIFRPGTANDKIILGGLGGGLFRKKARYHLGLPYQTLSAHGVIIGPPGSGKTATFFMNIARQWAPFGSAVILDIKRELYKYTAHAYSKVYTLDLIRPESSARLDLLGPCKENPEFAEELAALIIGVKNERSTGSENEEFWNSSSTLLLQALLLHVAFEDPTAHIGSVLDLIASKQLEDSANPEMSGHSLSIDKMLSESKVEEARKAWGLIRANDPKTLANIFATLTAKVNAFRSPIAVTLFTPPTEEERRKGVQLIELSILRQPGNAIYVSVSESQAAFFKNVLATIFGTFASYLRKTTEGDGSICLSLLDEAGTVPVRGLAEDINAGRGRRMAYCLGFQSLPQVEAIYGPHDAKAIVEGCFYNIVLPGVSGETAEWASRRAGRTTTFQHSTNDSKADMFDSSHMAEIGRELIDAYGVNRLLSFYQSILFLRDVPPCRLAFPENQKETNSAITHALDLIDGRSRKRLFSSTGTPLFDVAAIHSFMDAVESEDGSFILNAPEDVDLPPSISSIAEANLNATVPSPYYFRTISTFHPGRE